MNGLRRVIAFAADRGEGFAPYCGLQLLAWTVSAPIAAGALVVALLCLAP